MDDTNSQALNFLAILAIQLGCLLLGDGITLFVEMHAFLFVNPLLQMMMVHRITPTCERQ